MKKLYYITNVRMPTEKAHGIQMIKMSEAFAALGADLEFIVPNRKNVIEEDVFSYYGVKDIFKIRKIFCLDFIVIAENAETACREGWFRKQMIGRRSRNFYNKVCPDSSPLPRSLGGKDRTRTNFIEKWPRFGYWLQSFSFIASAVAMFLFTSRSNKLIYTREYLIAFIFKLLGFDTVYEAHRILLKKKTFFYLVKNIPYIITNSEGTAEEFTKRGFKNVLPLPNGVDLSEFKFKISKEELRNRFAIPQYKKIVLYTGNFYDWKGTDTLIEAAKLLQDKDIVVVFVGGKEAEVLSKREEMKNRGISNIFFLGHKNRKEIPYILKSADVLVLPNSPVSEESIKYTSPVKLGEYMASGVPIVASDLPSIRAIVSEKAALFFKPDDAEGLRDGILKLLGDDVLAGGLRANALQEVEKYTWETRARKILKFISF